MIFLLIASPRIILLQHFRD